MVPTDNDMVPTVTTSDTLWTQIRGLHPPSKELAYHGKKKQFTRSRNPTQSQIKEDRSEENAKNSCREENAFVQSSS